MTSHDLALIIVAAFSFLGTCVVSARYIIRYWFASRKLADKQKADAAYELASKLQKIVQDLLPVIKDHSATMETHKTMVESLERSVKELHSQEEQTKEMMRTLKIQYDNFQTRMNNVQSGGQEVLNQLDIIRTEVREMKNGYVYVQTKKK